MTAPLFSIDSHIARYPDFPKPGITFYDIGPVLESGPVLAGCIARMAEQAAAWQPDLIAGLDARGFLFATPMAVRLGIGAIMVRKAGKLPGGLHEESYALEYGSATIALQRDRQVAGKRVVLVDDLLATGGTLRAASKLIAAAGGVHAGSIVLIELTALRGRAAVAGPVASLQCYDL
ncbi:MAG: adenine phosphoribosyltransferase [Alphaproteobacteria bacterium]|nr:MAG: adenine phosphoribosyltransferase [Alphaproteobacteria bacterium]